MNMPGEEKTATGEGKLLIWHDAIPGHETDIEHWYNTEHHFERLDIPGFLEAHRYQASDTSIRRFMCLYRTIDPSILASDRYLERLNKPTPWTRKVMPLYCNFSRTVCETLFVKGRAEGAWSAVLAFSLSGKSPGGLTSDTMEIISENLMLLPGILRCQWLKRASPEKPSMPSIEAALRGAPDRQIDAAILIDTNFSDQALVALGALEEWLGKFTIRYDAQQRGCYQQVFSARRADA